MKPINNRPPQACAIARNVFTIPNADLAELSAAAGGPFSCIIGWYGKATVRPDQDRYYMPVATRVTIGKILMGVAQ